MGMAGEKMIIMWVTTIWWAVLDSLKLMKAAFEEHLIIRYDPDI